MSIRNKEYLELLRHSFDEKKFIEFIIDLLNLDISSLNRNMTEISSISNQYKDSVNYYKYIANYNDGMNDIGVFSIKLNDTTSTRARNMQRNFVASLLKKYELDGALVSFFSDKEKSWRFSFVKKELNFTDKGVKEELTSAKRFSYLVGEGESVHTAQEFLLKLLDIDDRKITLEDIEKQFDVEKVTKKFFEEYKEKYLQLKEFLDKNEDFQTEAKNCDFDSVEFAKKLMGQIVFLYFLQKKGWLGVQLIPNELSQEDYNELLSLNDSVSQNLIKSYYEYSGNKYIVEKTKLRITEVLEDVINLTNIFKNTKYDTPWGTGDKEFIRHIFVQAKIEHKNFFDDYLEYFFYKGLNEKRENQYFPLFNCKIPFLNGGLFEPLNNYRWSSAHFEIPNSLFSNDEKNGILDFLDLYNFTIDEEEPLEKDIAVDPEMLGKIFENLLDVDDRKSKGAFYTPREIVYYMCRESLANYLSNEVGINYEEILAFIKYGDVFSQHDWELSIDNDTNFVIGQSVYNNLLKIDEALFNVKIADPAVGSGAFPLGMLNEIVKLRNNIQTYILIQKELGVLSFDNLYNTEHLETDIYNMKLQTIENCIYAVDIETSAVDITKLRLWLSLIVDFPNDKEPRPLPNLDCKIMQGNSLVDEFEDVPLFSKKMLENNLKNYHRNNSTISSVRDIHVQQTLFEDSNRIDNYIEIMLNLQKEYFITSDSEIKKELKIKIENIQNALVEESLRENPTKLSKFKKTSQKRQKPWFIWELDFYDVFKNNNGFDIVIGNPPYVGEKGNKETFRLISDTKFGKMFYKRKMDLFYFFFHKGLNILKPNGILSMITTNYYPTATGAVNLRKDLYERTNVLKLINFNELKIFESAMGQHNLITILKKVDTHRFDIESCVINYKEKGYADSNKINNILNERDNNSDINYFKRDELFEQNEEKYIRFQGIIKNSKNSIDSILEKISNNKKLNYYCNINQGLRTGADKVSNHHINKYNLTNVSKDEGIFIITKEELEHLDLNDFEKSKIKPLFKNSDIYDKYYCNQNSSFYLIDLFYPNDRDIDISKIPNLINHLSKYKEILLGRSENANGIDKAFARGEYWYGSVRRKLDFDKEKIICPQRCSTNKFAYNSIPWYASADVYFITYKQELPLKYILGLLNSKTYYVWLYNRGKRKGEILELYEQPLSEIPIIVGNSNQINEIISLVDNILTTNQSNEDILARIDGIIYEMYNFTEEEIKIIENYFK